MQDFRIPKQIKKGRRKGKTKKMTSIFVLICIIVILLLTLLRVYPVFMEYAVDLCEDTAIMQINTSMQELIFENPDVFANLVTLERDSDNKITALTTDVIGIGQIKSLVVNDLYVHLDDLEQTTVEVPLGSIFAPSYFMGRGPSIDIGMASLTNISAEFVSSFSAAGINQTRHNIIIEVHADFRMLTPFGARDIEVVSSFPVTDTVIVGTVPERYTYITGTDSNLGSVSDSIGADYYNDTE